MPPAGSFHGHHPHSEPAEVITANLLRAAGVTVTGVDIDELDPPLTTGPQHGRDLAHAAARIDFTTASAAEPGQMPIRIRYALAMAAAAPPAPAGPHGHPLTTA